MSTQLQNFHKHRTTTSEKFMHKDQITFDGELIDVKYHDYRGHVVLDYVRYAGTERTFHVDSNRQNELINKLSGRF